jgi:predicted  nucleic acid-binding Zn-ribbon protein
MQHRSKLNGLSVPATATSVADAKVAALLRDYEYAKAEIKRLNLELALVREELHELEEATSDLVHLMI